MEREHRLTGMVLAGLAALAMGAGCSDAPEGVQVDGGAARDRAVAGKDQGKQKKDSGKKPPRDSAPKPDRLKPDAARTYPKDPFAGLNKIHSNPDIYLGNGTFGDKKGQLMVWAPKGYSPAKAWPLSVTLHGGFNTTDNKESIKSATGQLKWMVSQPGSDKMVWLAGIIRVSGSYHAWVKKQNTLDLIDAIREVDRRFRVDGRRVYLSGISMGGGGTASISWMLPRAFAAFGPTAGYYWNSWGKVPNLKGVSYRVVHGAKDKYPEEPYDRLKLAEQFVKIVKGAGATVEKVILSGVGHWLPTAQVPLLTGFLLKHQNKQPTDWAKARQVVQAY